ncbi:MAG: substrate-binding domain-containing protein [Thiolinea sp.]
MATLKDIARKLNLSVTTVSRALNGFPEVNEQTRQAVINTAQAMDYRPNQFARKLVTGQSGMVGMIAQASVDLSTDPLFVEIITGLSQHLAQRDVHFILHVSTENDILASYRYLQSLGMLDGYVLTRPLRDDARIGFLREHKAPFVLHGRVPGDNAYPYYDIDNYGSASQATRYLLDMGHQDIAFLNGCQQQGFAIDRLQGYLDTRIARQFPTPEHLIWHEVMTENYGYRAARHLLERPQGRPTAFLCANTLIASGVYQAVHEAGLQVARDISVIAHDDAVPQLKAIHFQPALTVTRSPLRNASEPLADLLVRHIQVNRWKIYKLSPSRN